MNRKMIWYAILCALGTAVCLVALFYRVKIVFGW